MAKEDKLPCKKKRPGVMVKEKEIVALDPNQTHVEEQGAAGLSTLLRYRSFYH
jgi:hypothetical protein